MTARGGGGADGARGLEDIGCIQNGAETGGREGKAEEARCLQGRLEVDKYPEDRERGLLVLKPVSSDR